MLERCAFRVFCLAAGTAGFILGTPALPACAVDLDAAKSAVSGASPSELRAEFHRRFEERSSTSQTRGLSPSDPDSPFAAFDDVTLLMAARSQARGIYGVDDRQDWYQISDEGVRQLARASAALFKATDTRSSQSSIVLKSRSLREAYRLCTGEQYATQPAAAFCSGTLVGPDMVLTAGHCVNEVSWNADIPPVSKVRFIFGYRMENSNANPTAFSPAQVFAGTKVLGGELSKTRDWALVRLSRPVPSNIAKPVTAWSKGPVAVGQRVFVIGYPSGTPLKYAPGAEVRDPSNPDYFVANLDTFGGNSGSGVFDQETHKLIGILVRGDTDYVTDTAANCRRVNICPNTGCNGEDVTHLSAVKALN